MWVVDWCMREVVVVESVIRHNQTHHHNNNNNNTFVYKVTQIMCATESRAQREMDVLLGAHLHETEWYLKPKSLNCLRLN